MSEHLVTRWLGLGAVGGCLAVLAGAFGAHGLADRLEPDRLAIWATASEYLMYHALAMSGVAFATHLGVGPGARTAGWCFVVGSVIFAGSLYALALSGAGWLGAITPVGGVCLICGWGCLAIASLRHAARRPTPRPQ